MLPHSQQFLVSPFPPRTIPRAESTPGAISKALITGRSRGAPPCTAILAPCAKRALQQSSLNKILRLFGGVSRRGGPGSGGYFETAHRTRPRATSCLYLATIDVCATAAGGLPFVLSAFSLAPLPFPHFPLSPRVLSALLQLDAPNEGISVHETILCEEKENRRGSQ